MASMVGHRYRRPDWRRVRGAISGGSLAPAVARPGTAPPTRRGVSLLKTCNGAGWHPGIPRHISPHSLRHAPRSPTPWIPGPPTRRPDPCPPRRPRTTDTTIAPAATLTATASTFSPPTSPASNPSSARSWKESVLCDQNEAAEPLPPWSRKGSTNISATSNRRRELAPNPSMSPPSTNVSRS